MSSTLPPLLHLHYLHVPLLTSQLLSHRYLLFLLLSHYHTSSLSYQNRHIGTIKVDGHNLDPTRYLQGDKNIISLLYSCILLNNIVEISFTQLPGHKTRNEEIDVRIKNSSNKIVVMEKILDKYLGEDDEIEDKKKILIIVNSLGELTDQLLIILTNYMDYHFWSYYFVDSSTPKERRKKDIIDFNMGKGDIFIFASSASSTSWRWDKEIKLPIVDVIIMVNGNESEIKDDKMYHIAYPMSESEVKKEKSEERQRQKERKRKKSEKERENGEFKKEKKRKSTKKRKESEENGDGDDDADDEEEEEEEKENERDGRREKDVGEEDDENPLYDIDESVIHDSPSPPRKEIHIYHLISRTHLEESCRFRQRYRENQRKMKKVSDNMKNKKMKSKNPVTFGNKKSQMENSQEDNYNDNYNNNDNDYENNMFPLSQPFGLPPMTQMGSEGEGEGEDNENENEINQNENIPNPRRPTGLEGLSEFLEMSQSSMSQYQIDEDKRKAEEERKKKEEVEEREREKGKGNGKSEEEREEEEEGENGKGKERNENDDEAIGNVLVSDHRSEAETKSVMSIYSRKSRRDAHARILQYAVGKGNMRTFSILQYEVASSFLRNPSEKTFDEIHMREMSLEEIVEYSIQYEMNTKFNDNDSDIEGNDNIEDPFAGEEEFLKDIFDDHQVEVGQGEKFLHQLIEAMGQRKKELASEGKWIEENQISYSLSSSHLGLSFLPPHQILFTSHQRDCSSCDWHGRTPFGLKNEENVPRLQCYECPAWFHLDMRCVGDHRRVREFQEQIFKCKDNVEKREELRKQPQFFTCFNHFCCICSQSPPSSSFLYRCVTCNCSYCETHLPSDYMEINRNVRKEWFHYTYKHYRKKEFFILCSPYCVKTLGEWNDLLGTPEKELKIVIPPFTVHGETSQSFTNDHDRDHHCPNDWSMTQEELNKRRIISLDTQQRRLAKLPPRPLDEYPSVMHHVIDNNYNKKEDFRHPNSLSYFSHCTCRNTPDDTELFISCEECAQWFHLRCVFLLAVDNYELLRTVEKWTCGDCVMEKKEKERRRREGEEGEKENLTETENKREEHSESEDSSTSSSRSSRISTRSTSQLNGESVKPIAKCPDDECIDGENLTAIFGIVTWKYFLPPSSPNRLTQILHDFHFVLFVGPMNFHSINCLNVKEITLTELIHMGFSRKRSEKFIKFVKRITKEGNVREEGEEEKEEDIKVNEEEGEREGKGEEEYNVKDKDKDKVKDNGAEEEGNGSQNEEHQEEEEEAEGEEEQPEGDEKHNSYDAEKDTEELVNGDENETKNNLEKEDGDGAVKTEDGNQNGNEYVDVFHYNPRTPPDKVPVPQRERESSPKPKKPKQTKFPPNIEVIDLCDEE